MKTSILKCSILVIIIALSAFSANCQIHRFVRGHFADDLYVYTVTEQPWYGNSLLYLKTNGSIISMQNNSNFMYSGGITAEPIPGMIISHSDAYFGKSIDYGKSFSFLAQFVNYYTSIAGLYGGEAPGEYIIQGFDPSVHPFPHGVIYKTTDYFSHYTLIADTSHGLAAGDIGSVSGELFQMLIINKYSFLVHSLDFGATSDTIPVDTTILNENTGLKFHTLSRGSAPGELFLVTKKTVSATEIHYFIYRTANYGASWQLKSTHVFDSDRQQFTAGRGACKFYIANLKTISGSTYYKLQILYSADCGETFTTYEHMLTPDVGIKKADKAENDILITPNPATDKVLLHYNLASVEKITVQLYTLEGKLVETLVNENQSPGLQSIEYNCSKLPSGIYVLKVSGDNGSIKTGKLVKL